MRNNNRRQVRNNNQSNRNRRNSGYRGRNAGHFDQDDNDNQITPQQRRHASNQQNKFLDLAKNARQAGERVETEYYMQHVEHYTRILNLADEQYKEREEARKKTKGEDEDFTTDSEEASNESDIVTEESDEGAPDSADDEVDNSDENDKKAPVKKARVTRKPRVSIKEKEEDVDDTVSTAEEVEDKPKPRRRGRPRKTEAAENSEDSGSALQHVLPIAKEAEAD